MNLTSEEFAHAYEIRRRVAVGSVTSFEGRHIDGGRVLLHRIDRGDLSARTDVATRVRAAVGASSEIIHVLDGDTWVVTPPIDGFVSVDVLLRRSHAAAESSPADRQLVQERPAALSEPIEPPPPEWPEADPMFLSDATDGGDEQRATGDTASAEYRRITAERPAPRSARRLGELSGASASAGADPRRARLIIAIVAGVGLLLAVLIVTYFVLRARERRQPAPPRAPAVAAPRPRS